MNISWWALPALLGAVQPLLGGLPPSPLTPTPLTITPLPTAQLRTPAPPLSPGIYHSKPASMVVVVPRAMDPAMIRAPGPSSPPMPMVEPPSRLVPRTAQIAPK